MSGIACTVHLEVGQIEALDQVLTPAMNDLRRQPGLSIAGQNQLRQLRRIRMQLQLSMIAARQLSDATGETQLMGVRDA